MRLQQKFFNSDFIPTESVNYTNTNNLISQGGGKTDMNTLSIPKNKSTSQYSTSQYSTSQYSTSQYSSTVTNDSSSSSSTTSSSTSSSSITNSDSDSDESLDHKKPKLARQPKKKSSKTQVKKDSDTCI